MNINPISFKGVKIDYGISRNIPKKKGEEKPTGFCQVLNFLDKDETHDFEITKRHGKTAEIGIYSKRYKIQTGSVKIPLSKFAKKPDEVIGKIGKAVYSGKDFGRKYWMHLFQTQEQNDSDSIIEEATVIYKV